MRNLPYSTPSTKALAQRQLELAKQRQNRGNSLLLFIGLPFAMYLGLFFASPEYVRNTVHPLAIHFMKKTNEWVRKQALTTQPVLEKTEAVVEKQIEPIVRSLQPTDVVAATGEDAVFGENLPKDYAVPEVTIEMILSDYDRRIPQTFDIPENLRKRVGFWLSIYSVYSSRYHIIHHVEYPWIVYKVVDTTPIVEGPGNKWTRYHRADKYVEQAIAKVRSDLKNLSVLQSKKLLTSKKLSADQDRYLQILSALPGGRSRNLSLASQNVRVQLGQKDFFRMGLIRGSKYLPRMEEIFAQYDLPIELTRLPLVESSFNDRAVSKVGASGIWQFMPTIGKHYMKVSDTIDERNSPLKATEGAAKLMLSNFRITKRWPFAITAYNHGPGGILRASKKLKTNDLAVIIDKYNSRSFGFASSNFYTSYLAALHAERYQEEIFGDIPKYPPHETEDIRLTQSFKAQKLVSILGITYEELKLYNKDLRTKAFSGNTSLPKGYRLFLPPGRRARLELYTLNEKSAVRSKGAQRKPRGPKRIQITFDDEAPRSRLPQPETESL